MQWRNTATRYGAVAQALHWLIALGMIGMAGLGLYMVDLPPLERYELTQLHKSVGLVLLLLIALRLVWRAVNPVPPVPGTLTVYQRVLAHATHVGLYASLIVFPVSGWLMVSASNLPIGEIFGLAPIPDLLATDERIEQIAETVHWAMLYILAALLALHVFGAIFHHAVLKDDVLRRMLPGTARAPTDRP